MTSGCLASRLATRLGASPDVEIHSANAASYLDSDVVDANAWAQGQGVEIVYAPFSPLSPTGNLQFIDRFFDFMARYAADSYVAAAGNTGLGTPVGNIGWNVITAGSHTDGGNGDWDGDVMGPFSATGNPVTGCEKPNLVANGQDIDTLGSAPTWLASGVSGTSFATAHASGNLANRLPSLYPQAAMALVMATAWHNIEGARRLSDQDGAGGLHGLAAFRCANEGRAPGGWLQATSFGAASTTTWAPTRLATNDSMAVPTPSISEA